MLKNRRNQETATNVKALGSRNGTLGPILWLGLIGEGEFDDIRSVIEKEPTILRPRNQNALTEPKRSPIFFLFYWSNQNIFILNCVMLPEPKPAGKGCRRQSWQVESRRMPGELLSVGSKTPSELPGCNPWPALVLMPTGGAQTPTHRKRRWLSNGNFQKSTHLFFSPLQ